MTYDTRMHAYMTYDDILREYWGISVLKRGPPQSKAKFDLSNVAELLS